MPREEALEAFELFKDHATNRLEIARFFSLASGEAKVHFVEEIVDGVSKLRLVDAQDADAGRELGGKGDGGEEVRGPGFQMGDRVLIHSLEKATRHNGKAGVLVQYDFQAGRWEVALDPRVCVFGVCCMYACAVPLVCGSQCVSLSLVCLSVYSRTRTRERVRVCV